MVGLLLRSQQAAPLGHAPPPGSVGDEREGCDDYLCKLQTILYDLTMQYNGEVTNYALSWVLVQTNGLGPFV